MEQLKEMLKNKFPAVDFDNETTLTSSGILDSLAVVTIIAEIEELFDIYVRCLQSPEGEEDHADEEK